jgi:hypothetical protein
MGVVVEVVPTWRGTESGQVNHTEQDAVQVGNRHSSAGSQMFYLSCMLPQHLKKRARDF